MNKRPQHDGFPGQADVKMTDGPLNDPAARQKIFRFACAYFYYDEVFKLAEDGGL